MYLFNEWYYILILAVVMVLSGLIKQNNLFAPFYNFLINKIKSKKLLVVLISMFGGILPIPGRVIVSAGLLDTLAPLDKDKRSKFGVIDYIATHHYYLWSPLEKTILIPMAVLGLSYFELLQHTLPLLIVSILFLIIYVLRLDSNDIEIRNTFSNNKKITNKKKWYNFIDIKLLLFVFCVIVFGNYIKQFSDDIKIFIESFSVNSLKSHFTFALLSAFAFIGSFILGSSSKFASMVSLLTSIFGMPYFTYLFALEYAGYLLSPSHKCVAISMSYFNTPIQKYYKVILIWSGLLVITGILTLL